MIISDRIKILDQSACDFVRGRGKEAYVKSTSLRSETFYKAGVVGEPAPTQRNPRFSYAGKERGCGEEVHTLTGGDLGVVRPGSQYARQRERLCQQSAIKSLTSKILLF
jgi:hypothetical protein